MKKFYIISLVIILSSCGILIHRKVNCRPYKLDFEEYWVQGNIGLSGIIFKDKNEKEILFLVKDKWIAHIDNYISDTGQGCLDGSAQLLKSKNDSIWMSTESRYVENNKPNYRERVTISSEGEISKFTMNDLTLGKEIINSDTILTRIYESDTISKGAYSITFGRGIGPIRIKYRNGDIWNNKNPKVKLISPISTYRNGLIKN